MNLLTLFPPRQGFRVVQVEECWFQSLAPLMAEVRSQMGSGPVYLSFDIDALDPGFAPGTGTPEIGGLTPIQVSTEKPLAVTVTQSCIIDVLSWLGSGSGNYSRLPGAEPCWMWPCGGVASLWHHRFELLLLYLLLILCVCVCFEFSFYYCVLPNRKHCADRGQPTFWNVVCPSKRQILLMINHTNQHGLHGGPENWLLK